MKESEMLQAPDLKTLIWLREDSIREILQKTGQSRRSTLPVTDALQPEQNSAGSERKKRSSAVESD